MQQRAFMRLAAAVFVVLLCAAGLAGKAQAQFSPPTVTNVNPNTGPPSGGTSVIITGSNFFVASAVSFGSTAASSFTIDSSTQITAISPAGIGTVDVTVTTPGGTSSVNSSDRFTYARAAATTTLSSSRNPSSFGQSVQFTVTVAGFSPTGSVSLFDGGTQIGTATLAGGTATVTISSLAVGSHSLTARHDGDANNAASTSPVLIQTVNVPTDSIKLREMQVSVTPMIAQISGQAIVGAIDNAIEAGFSDNPQALTPNGAGFTVQIPLGQPAAAPAGTSANRTERTVWVAPGAGTQRTVQLTAGSLANGLHGGNGAPFGTRLIDMAVMPLPPGSGMPANGETQMSQNELVAQFGFGTTPQQIDDIAQRFGLTVVEQQTVGVLGRPVYTFRIPDGQSVREVIGRVQAAGLNVAVQPKYNYRLTQDRSNPNADQGDPAQYIVNKFHFAELHRITKGARAVVAVIDSQIDSNQPNLAGTISDRYDAGCAASSPHPHGTGMAGAIAAHGQLVGVAPQANIIAVCAFGGGGQAEASTMHIIKGLDYAIQRGARIVNMYKCCRLPARRGFL